MIAWSQVKCRWAEQSQALIVHEFLASKKLFGELVEFAKKRR